MKPELEELIKSTLRGFVEIRMRQTLRMQKEVDKVVEDYLNNVCRSDREMLPYFKDYYRKRKESYSSLRGEVEGLHPL